MGIGPWTRRRPSVNKLRHCEARDVDKCKGLRAELRHVLLIVEVRKVPGHLVVGGQAHRHRRRPENELPARIADGARNACVLDLLQELLGLAITLGLSGRHFAQCTSALLPPQLLGLLLVKRDLLLQLCITQLWLSKRLDISVPESPAGIVGTGRPPSSRRGVLRPFLVGGGRLGHQLSEVGRNLGVRTELHGNRSGPGDGGSAGRARDRDTGGST